MDAKIKLKQDKEKQKRATKTNKNISAEKIEQAILKTKTAALMEKIFKKRPMPKFVMFSKLDKNLLKQMLVKATEI